MSDTHVLENRHRGLRMHARVEGAAAHYMETLPMRMDRLVEAALLEEWHEVRRLSDMMLQRAREYGYTELADCAADVCREAAKSANELGIKRSIVHLISSCGKSQVRVPQHN